MYHRCMDEFYREFGSLVRDIRRSRRPRVTQARLAELLGMSRTSVTNLEGGKQHVPLHVLAQLVEVLDVAVWKLLPNRLLFPRDGPTSARGDMDRLHEGLRRYVASVWSKKRVDAGDTGESHESGDQRSAEHAKGM